jgi:hypothetical protein
MLEAYQQLPIEKLFCWKPVHLSLDLKALISRHGVRVNCAICGEEILNEREVIVDGQMVCRACSGDSYYRLQPETAMGTRERPEQVVTIQHSVSAGDSAQSAGVISSQVSG